MVPFMLCPRYCGELSSLAITSTTNVLEVHFHSDESHTDKGFSAEYSAYDPSNRELKAPAGARICVTCGGLGEVQLCDSDTHGLPLWCHAGRFCVV